MRKKIVWVAECKRCGREWTPIVDMPKYCPFCKSPLWNQNRVYVDHNQEKEKGKC